jgi:hypothetical protein
MFFEGKSNACVIAEMLLEEVWPSIAGSYLQD